jgi:GH24 family phage-related lysozyme (muramidase)
MSNKTSADAIALIKEAEGCELKAYLCPAGVPTIGYGHTKTVSKNDVKRRKTITEDEAERLLKADLAEYEAGVARLVKVPLTDDQFGALVSFAYNLGVGALGSSTLLKRINSKASLADIERAWVQWDKGRVNGVLKPLAGLTKRRKAEFALFSGR